MVAPGQENILEEYIQEQQQGDPELLAGKFRNQDELLKGYEELQRKLGQQDAPAEQQQNVESYTQEQAVEVYGKEAVDSLQSKGINLAEVMFKADAGEDISNTYDDLAAASMCPAKSSRTMCQRRKLVAARTPDQPSCPARTRLTSKKSSAATRALPSCRSGRRPTSMSQS